MLIFDEHYKPIVLDDLNNSVMSDCFWILDLNMMDFTPIPLLILEEITSKSLELTIGNNSIIVPADWYVMIVSDETSQLDVLELGKDVPGMGFHAFTYGLEMKTFEPVSITVTNYFQNFKSIAPALSKHQMLCHPISEHAWINITPHDNYNKYFKNVSGGDLI